MAFATESTGTMFACVLMSLVIVRMMPAETAATVPAAPWVLFIQPGAGSSAAAPTADKTYINKSTMKHLKNEIHICSLTQIF